MNFDDIYAEEVTQNSFSEMINVCKWLNDIYGYHPIIIGGWAVYFHHPSLGSRDIDILFPNRELKHEVINKYLTSNNYQSEGIFEKQYFKEVETSSGKQRILIDCCSIEDLNRLKGTEIILPWELAFQYQKLIKIHEIELYIPQIEVLLMYKAKAALDREKDLSSTSNPFYLRQKIIKDYHDIVNLISNSKINCQLLNKLLNKYNFNDYFKSAIEKIETKSEILDKYKSWLVTKEKVLNTI